MNPLAGFVLAGGRSTRMGTDKALLELDGEPLIARGLRLLGEVCTDVAIAGGSPELARFARLIPDDTPGLGPLSGLVAALEQSAFDWNAFVPVDVPFIPPSVWTQLLAHASGIQTLAILVRTDGREQPLCGLYSRRAAPFLRQSLAAGTLKIRAALSSAGPVHWVDFPETHWFRNVNTPEDFAALHRS